GVRVGYPRPGGHTDRHVSWAELSRWRARCRWPPREDQQPRAPSPPLSPANLLPIHCFPPFRSGVCDVSRRRAAKLAHVRRPQSATPWAEGDAARTARAYQEFQRAQTKLTAGVDPHAEGAAQHFALRRAGRRLPPALSQSSSATRSPCVSSRISTGKSDK